jgi:DinB family
MALSEALLSEFDQEMANTRRSLERVPGDKFDWKPHPKSMTLGSLATFLAILPSWGTTTIAQDSLDLLGPAPPAPAASSAKDLLELFDKNAADARRTIAGASDQHLMKPWTLLKGGKSLLSQPRIAVLRSFVMNHMIHHRGQLSVYLRMNDVPVPAIYGPSADEEKW